jgi:hypothetical protein
LTRTDILVDPNKDGVTICNRVKAAAGDDDFEEIKMSALIYFAKGPDMIKLC